MQETKMEKVKIKRVQRIQSVSELFLAASGHRLEKAVLSYCFPFWGDFVCVLRRLLTCEANITHKVHEPMLKQSLPCFSFFPFDKPQRGCPKRAELSDVNINTYVQITNTERAYLNQTRNQLPISPYWITYVYLSLDRRSLPLITTGPLRVKVQSESFPVLI